MQDRRGPGNARLIKQINREAILYHLRTKGRLSRADLADLTALSKPSISALVEGLLEEGWIREVGTGESSGGRRPILLEINAEAFAIVGAVFEGAGLALAISDLNGEILAERHAVIRQTSKDTLLDELEGHIRSLLGEARAESRRVLGIGLGVPGVTPRGSGVVRFSPSTGWNDRPVLQELEKRFSLPVFLENDVNLMALGEFYKGAGRGVQNLVYMHVGTGIGAGIVLDGQLYRGFSDAAGEIGYMIVGDPAQGAGREFGTFEGNYSTAAVRERMMAHPELQALCRDLAPGESVIQRLADEARTSTEAGRLFEDICLHWAYGIANLVCVLNPELVILGGDLVHIGDHGLSYIRDRLARLVPIVPDVRLAQLGSRAGVVGAFFYVLESDPSLTGKLGAFERGEETP